MNKIKVILSEEARNFIKAQNGRVQNKIERNIYKIESGIVSNDLFKKITQSGIWEMRTSYEGMEYRILAFWDKQRQSIVIATHGFVKKMQKTPAKEIEKAEKIMREYYKSNR